MPSGCGPAACTARRLRKDRLDIWKTNSNEVESVNIERNVAHDRVDTFASVGFFDRVNCADNRVERGANRVDSDHNWVGFCNRVDFYHIRVGLSQSNRFCHNRVDFFSVESVYHNLVGFFQSSRFITIESIFVTIESILNTIESIPNTIESILEPRTTQFLYRQF